ncbi:MAG: hypothetical protein ACRDZY_06665 [Acidimicrobiales bacterium]
MILASAIVVVAWLVCWRVMTWLDRRFGDPTPRDQPRRPPSSTGEFRSPFGDVSLSSGERTAWLALQARAQADGQGLANTYRTWLLGGGLRRSRRLARTAWCGPLLAVAGVAAAGVAETGEPWAIAAGMAVSFGGTALLVAHVKRRKATAAAYVTKAWRRFQCPPR